MKIVAVPGLTLPVVDEAARARIRAGGGADLVVAEAAEAFEEVVLGFVPRPMYLTATRSARTRGVQPPGDSPPLFGSMIKRNPTP